MIKEITETSDFLKGLIGDFKPKIGVVLGSGLSKMLDEIDILFEIDYKIIPNFVRTTLDFHKEKLIFGLIGNQKVVCMQGRFHYYEGYSMDQITFPIRIIKQLGIETLIISNASGGLNPSFNESDLMIINDHISSFIPSPLRGPNSMGDRFPDMSEPYSKELINIARSVIKDFDISGVHEGTYVAVPGPQLETKAEYKMLRNFGADAVGMSTVPEVIVARQMNLNVFGLCAITDLCIPEHLKVAKIENILMAAAKAEPKMALLIKELIIRL